MLLLPMLLSSLLLGAHFYRAENYWLVPVALAMPMILSIGRTWSVRVVQFMLVLGSLEWLRSMMEFTLQRQQMGMPYERLIVILSSVAAFTMLAAVLLETPGMKRRLRFASRVSEASMESNRSARRAMA
jgi:hypothetical protein